MPIDHPTLPSRRDKVNNIKDYEFSGRTGIFAREHSAQRGPLDRNGSLQDQKGWLGVYSTVPRSKMKIPY
jgi:hypothetical protein